MTRLIALVGPTAAGKSRVAMQVAERCGAEILSVDSMQVYRGMDIGTAKPSAEERARVVHHMVDVVDPAVPYTVADFRTVARAALAGTDADTVLVVGGSGLHFRSVVDPMRFMPRDVQVGAEIDATEIDVLREELTRADPDAGAYMDLANPRRVRRAVEALRLGGPTPSDRWRSEAARMYRNYESEIEFSGIGIDRDDLTDRVRDRLVEMRRQGLMAEVAALAPRLGPTAREAVGYKQLLGVVAGRYDEESGFESAHRATIKLVKRQRTFFRRDPRLTWIDAASPDPVKEVLVRSGL